MSSKRHCPACGAEVGENARFCTNCGAKLEDATDTTASFSPLTPDSQPASPPTVPQQAPYAPSSGPSRNRNRGLTIALASVAAAIAVLAIVLVAINYVPRQTDSAENAAATTEEQTAEANANASTSDGSGQEGGSPDQGSQSSTNVTIYTGGGSSPTVVSSGGSDPSEASVLSSLQSYKATLSSLDSEIRSVATDFNRYAKSGSWDQQEAAASTAGQVQGRVSSSSSSFDAVYVPTSSAYYGTYQSMQTCYDDLQNRIDCMASAWSLRLNGNSDYLAPIRAQNDSRGVNRYKTDFESRMAGLGI